MSARKSVALLIGIVLISTVRFALYTASEYRPCLPEAKATVAELPAYPGAQAICFTSGEPSSNNTTSPFLTSWLSFQTGDSPQDILHLYRQKFRARSDHERSAWRLEDRGSALVFFRGDAPDILFTNPAEFDRNKAKYAPIHVLIYTITPRQGWLPWQNTRVAVQIQQIDIFQ